MNSVPGQKVRVAGVHLEEMTRLLNGFLTPDQDPRQIRKREQILLAATEHFVAHGYRRTSMDDIAQAVGVAKGTLYLYYQNKAELLIHAAATQNLQYMDRIQEVLERSNSPAGQLHGMIALTISLSSDAPLMARLTAGDHELELVMSEARDETLAQVSRMKVDFIAALIHAMDARASVEEAEAKARLLIDLMFAVMNSGRKFNTTVTVPEYARMLADLVIDGLVPPNSTLKQL